MKKISVFLLLILSLQNFSQSSSQSIGDTVVVKTFKYGSATRDTFISFPNGSTTYEKIIMKYNMRCKNGLISNSSARNQGCGEWDYSCNTYIADSSRMEIEPLTHPNYIINNFTGTVFPYSSSPVYDYYNYSQTSVTLNNINSETQYTVGAGTNTISTLLKSNERSGKTQLLYTAAELTAAGFTAGNIHGIILNVSNAGGVVNFFNLGIQHSTLTALSSASVTQSGFTNVYNSNYTFNNGNNRVQFHTPFNWNGTDNILIEYSFTNSGNGNPVVLNGISTTSVNALYSNNNYAVDLSTEGSININTSFLSTINNEITVSFWAYGNSSFMPTNTCLLYAYANNANQKMLNIHLPWGDNNVYFDAGYNNGQVDRINKAATAPQQGGQWNHWAFTKNTNTGWMRIYLNGALWTSGNAKVNPVTILNMILGKDVTMSNNYKGKINEFTIWNKELNATDIKSIMNKPVDASHPYYTNLLAYYKMNEGSGLTINDSKNSVNSTGTNIFWTYDRGNKLYRSFYESNLKPNVILLNGSYSITTNTVTAKDSIARTPSIIQQFSVTSNATVTPFKSDAVVLVSTTYTLYNASASKVYNGDTGVLTGTVNAPSTGTLNIVNMNYFKRHPYYIELMSFVTPYGIGLDMGMKGKTWYFDVTDYAPLLKGNKRFLMALGGEWQEQMDIDFLFIEGTPPRNVLDCYQLWQGGARIGGSSINSINNDIRFNTQTVTINPAGKSFKMRSTITGHGAEGEFSQNGGVVTHYFNIAGGANEFAWPITRSCAGNPVFPQGGTWIYDRQGWCPGEYSLLKEYDISTYVTPGSTVTLDYNCSNPQNASGDYRYIAAHQLITYGSPNFSLDASMVDVQKPSNKVLFSRENPMCAKPMIIVRNTGSSALTDLDIDYWINSSSVKQSYHWTGNLAFMDTTIISLPIGSLWLNGLNPSKNVFNVELVKANNMTDNYSYNNKYASDFTLADIITDSLTVEFRTNNYPSENTYYLLDANNNVVPGASFLANANTVYTDNYLLNGCYKLVVEDLGEDGLEWWANSAQGSGSVKLKNAQGNIIKTFQTDFGKRFEYSFSTKPYAFVGVKENMAIESVQLHPNPAHDKFQLTVANTENMRVTVSNMLGQNFELPFTKTKDTMIFDSSSLKPGVYLVKIAQENKVCTKKIVID